jgi:DNA adenine methylase
MVDRMAYPGSKGQAGVFQRIIGQMPPHDVYVEPFFGSGQIFWRKRPAQASIVIDRVPGCTAEAGATAGVRAICGDAISILPTLGPLLASEALIYCDPPYLLQTRQGRRYYEHELADSDHAALLSVLTKVACRVMISGYPSALYAAELRNWRCIEYRTRTRGKTVRECLWCNFPEPAELHDWRYAGGSFRERLSFKRLAERWLSRLQRMSPRQRGFLLAMISQRQQQRAAPATNARPGDAISPEVLRARNGDTVPDARNGAVGR